MMYLGFLLCLVAGTYAQRYVIPAAAIAKDIRCTGYDFVTASPLGNGTTFIDRAFFMYANHRQACAPGTLFSIKRTLCVCDTVITNAVRQSGERCATVAGNLQGNQQFTITQLNFPPYNGFVTGFGDTLIDENSCIASNLNSLRCIPFFADSSLGRRQLTMTVGFNFPTLAPGNEYTILTNGACLDDAGLAVPPSFEVKFVTGNPNQPNGANHQVQVNVQFGSTDNNIVTEVSGTFRCSIPAAITVNGQPFSWDSNDVTNQLALTLDLTGTTIFSFSITNSAIRGVAGVPVGGFCTGPQTQFPLATARRGYVVARRVCPLCLGGAPVGTFMCMNDVTVVRDCQ